MAGLAIADMPGNIKGINCFIIERTSNEFDHLIKPERIYLKIIFDLLKILLSLILVYWLFLKKALLPKWLFYTALMGLIVFLYFDLPIHRCYNGGLESFWEVGRHFH